jgi:hypothetical protein
VVSTRQDAGLPATGKGTQPITVTTEDQARALTEDQLDLLLVEHTFARDDANEYKLLKAEQARRKQPKTPHELLEAATDTELEQALKEVGSPVSLLPPATIQAEIDKTDTQIAALKRTIDKLNAELLKPLPPPKPTKPVGSPTSATTTPATPPKPPAPPTKGVDAALRALGGDPNKKLNLPTVVPTVKPNKKVSGLTPTAADMAWYKSQMPAAKGAGGATSIPKDLQKTAQTPAAVKTGTDKTTNAVKELTAKITSQSSLQTSVAAIYNLMASGMLRVQTNMVGPMQTGTTQLLGTRDNPLPPVPTASDLINNADFSKWPTATPAPQPRYAGALGDAVASEMKHKPAGSSLVVANSSETVIPAAGGHGMLDFVETLRAGFSAMIATYKETQTRQDNTLKAIKNTLVSNQMQTNARLQKLETKFTSPSMPGGLGGAAAGGVDAFTPIAQRMGLSMTSGYRPGDSGWHGANRARDFSNGSGPTPQMMQFAQYMASTYGANLKELIYTPLGFSIKNGQKVAPYAQGAHNNHVHVAYALGPEQGRMFNSLSAAQGWEQSMVPGSVKVASITGNSGEGFGETNVTNNMTITQQPGEDGEALANRVATLFFDAVSNARSSSIFM